MTEKKATARKQKIVKDGTKFKFIILSTLVLLLLVGAACAPFLVPFDPYVQDLNHALQPPDSVHLLGTDRFGRDLLSRVIMGSRTTIYSSLLLVIIITVVGTAVGVFCGYHGGTTDSVIMRKIGRASCRERVYLCV